MLSGCYWSGVIPAGTTQDTGAVPDGQVRTVNINIVNLGTSPATLRLFVGPLAAPTAAHRVEPDIVLAGGANGPFQRRQVVGAGERVVIYSSAEITARIDGFAEVAQ